jgi:hypothetical protein
MSSGMRLLLALFILMVGEIGALRNFDAGPLTLPLE